jgi:hypothetical protein
MWEDPIVAEVHRARREIFARFDNDMGAYIRHIQQLEEEERKRGRVIIDTPFRQPERVKPDAA